MLVTECTQSYPRTQNTPSSCPSVGGASPPRSRASLLQWSSSVPG